MMDYPFAKLSLVIVLSAVLILSCGQTDRQTDRQTKLITDRTTDAVNCYSDATTVGVSNYKDLKHNN